MVGKHAIKSVAMPVLQFSNKSIEWTKWYGDDGSFMTSVRLESLC